MIRLVDDVDVEGIVILGVSQSHARRQYRDGEDEVEDERRVNFFWLFAGVDRSYAKHQSILQHPPQKT